MQAAFPTRAIALLLAIGFLDLVVTAVLHACGLIREQNPLMRPLIEHSEWLFVVVKAMTLGLAYAAMIAYAKVNKLFVKRVCIIGSAAYVVVWIVWFASSL